MFKQIDSQMSTAGQLDSAAVSQAIQSGFKTIICNRPDSEKGAVSHTELLNQARQAGVAFIYHPVKSASQTDMDARLMAEIIDRAAKPVLAYCRTGARSAKLYEMARAQNNLSANKAHHQILIVGAGAAGLSVAASLLERNSSLDIAVIDPADAHFYQPGWTMVGGGIFTPEQTVRTMAALVPAGVKWVRDAVESFQPAQNRVTLASGRQLAYEHLVVCPGLQLDWEKIDGLAETLGQNGVTSNYRFDLAPYTWELVQNMRRGKALFTQPPMPIKCAGAPQKALYLSADHWKRSGVLNDIQIDFNNAGGVLFGVADYVPALTSYIEKYRADLSFFHNLIAVDGSAKKAVFEVTNGKKKSKVEKSFDMMHVCPPQSAPDFIKASPLADETGWLNVDQHSLRHVDYDNIWGLGDATNTPNAKTAAAVRKQAPIVALNLLASIEGQETVSHYDGYGSCPLTVERGKIVLAEFGYGGKIIPTFPTWMLQGLKATRAAWFLKETILPPMYWRGMLKGKEWLAKPDLTKR